MELLRLRLTVSIFAATLLFLLCQSGRAETGPDDDLPNAPVAAQQQGTATSEQKAAAASQVVPANTAAGHQTKRILGIVPNFRSVSVDQKLPPQSAKDKFITTTEDSFDYSSFIFVGALAGVSMAQDSFPEFHQGAAGYGRYYWHTFVDQADENYMVEFLLPTALHQDSRYYTLERGNKFKRGAYAFSRILITRGDNGNAEPNYSEVIGAGAASGISNFYYPSPNRTWTKTGQRWLTSVVLDGATFTVKEFWPDINNAFFHQKD